MTRRMISGVLMLAVVGGACVAAADSAPLNEWLAGARLPQGWTCKNDAASYDAKNLFELIDGEAELYFPYGFKRATTMTYASEAKPEETISAEVYEMGSLLDAFGVYSNYRDEGSRLVKVGVEGFAGGTQIMFYQDRFFVKLRSNKQFAAKEALLNCGIGISRALPASPSPPEELDMLRMDGIQPQTQQYFAQSLLGYDFFPVGLSAHAVVGKNRVRVFVVLDTTSKTAKETLAQYVAYLDANKAKHFWREMTFGKVFVARDPLHQTVALKTVGNCIVGVAKLAEPEQGYPLIERLQAAVQEAAKKAKRGS